MKSPEDEETAERILFDLAREALKGDDGWQLQELLCDVCYARVQPAL